MIVATFLMHVLDVVFFIGVAGSTIVVIFTAVEDLIELSSK